MDRRKFIKAASVGALTTVVAGCLDQGGGDGGGGNGGGGGDTTTTTTTTQTTQTTTGGGSGQLKRQVGQTPPGIKVMNLKLSRTNAGAKVTGTVKNTGNKTYEELEVQATLFDQSDDILGRFFDNTEETEKDVTPLKPGDSWQFSIDFPSADLGKAAGYRIDVDGDIDQSVNIGTGNGTGNDTLGNGSVGSGVGGEGNTTMNSST